MKVMELAGDWGVENLHLSERPEPSPGPGEVTIAMRAVSINPRDLIMVKGGYGRRGGKPPIIPLCDGAGEIAEIGEGVSGLAVGDLVCPTYSRSWLHGIYGRGSSLGAHGGPLDGTMQEKFLIPAQAVVKAPAHMSAPEAATLTCAAVTAWNALIEQGALRAGQRVVLQGTGGVSLFALQIAKMQGAEVIIISSSDEKLERAKSLGADHGINYVQTPDWHDEVRKLSNGREIDHIIELGGASTIEKSLKIIKPGGVLSLIGILGGVNANLNLGRLVTSNIRLQGITVGSRDMFANMVRAMELHKIHPVIDEQRFAFDQLGPALAALPQGKHFGKVVCEL